MAHRPHNANFSDSQEATFRRFVRGSVRNAPLSRAERDIVMALVNLWLEHRKKADGVIHPGRKRIARKAKVSIITVARCFAKLREKGALAVVSHGRGEGQKPTHYRVDYDNLMKVCGHKYLPIRAGQLAQIYHLPQAHNDTPLGSPNDTPQAYHDDTQYKGCAEKSLRQDSGNVSRPLPRLVAGGAR